LFKEIFLGFKVFLGFNVRGPDTKLRPRETSI